MKRIAALSVAVLLAVSAALAACGTPGRSLADARKDYGQLAQELAVALSPDLWPGWSSAPGADDAPIRGDAGCHSRLGQLRSDTAKPLAPHTWTDVHTALNRVLSAHGLPDVSEEQLKGGYVGAHSVSSSGVTVRIFTKDVAEIWVLATLNPSECTR
ncbi:hypothetical protein [Psychromicrobium xiongbiense]|uniref:hypothetical protein n=1 Tax=Psychromicrobium xiongbiense TaxID=3051184 RepID=UPI00255619C8|nr:hypothetical protein [Psychromicrobium sp. YIM S02556]